MAWTFEHSVESAVPREFAWKYWTNIENWDDPPARFALDGTFQNGAKLRTILPGQELVSVIRDVEEGRAARIEMELPGAVMTFQFCFEDAGPGRTRITQTLSLTGESAEELEGQAKVLEETVPQGMNKLAHAMARK